MMLLSIIIPCYNCESNIEKLLLSIKEQLNETVQLVLINDGSWDATHDIITKFTSDNPSIKIKYINSINQGAAKARSTGLNYAEGDYVFFCDSDDMISANFISVFTELSNDKPDMIYFCSTVLDSQGNRFKKVHFPLAYIESNSNEVFNYLLKKGQWTAAVWTYIFRKDLVLKSGAIFTDRKVHEDHLFTLRLLADSEKISICNSELYFQNVTSGSLTKSPKKIDYLTERYKSYKEAREDIIYKFSQESIVLYDRWSMSSLLQILKENKKMVFQGIMHTAIYRVLWKEKLVILDFVKSKVKKKITRSKSLSQ